MAAQLGPQTSIFVAPATPGDIPNLVPVFSKAFHPTSPYMVKAIPPTRLVSDWWSAVHTCAVTDPSIVLLKAFLKSPETGAEIIIGLARYRLPQLQALPRAGLWDSMPLTEDHDQELCHAFISLLGDCRDRVMNGRPHYFIELLGTVHEEKGKGVGRALLQWGCDRADEESVEVFVETNPDALGFYQKVGFEVREEADMPGGYGYRESILVRQPRSRDTGADVTRDRGAEGKSTG